MENNKKKCSFKEHEEINANYFCQECKIYMCNKCEMYHSKLLQSHNSYNLDKEDINELFNGFCKEENHLDRLKYFCKTHNQLCCASCITKIKGKGNGQHTDCEIFYIEDIKDEKKNKLKEHIKNLENFFNNLEEKINQLKMISEKVNKDKEELKLKIQKVFTKLRNVLNEREDELLLEVDKQYDDLFFNKDIIKQSEKLPNKIKLSLEKGKKIDNEWNYKNKLSLLINYCKNIENNIKEINDIDKNMTKFKESKEIKINFAPEDKDIEQFLKIIKTFGKIYNNKNWIFFDSLIIENNQLYINNLINWINLEETFKTRLLYRKSRDGDSYTTFHKLCDKQGATIVLFKSTEGFIIGGYTTLDWDTETSGWKIDSRTFVFSLTNNKIFNKIDKNIFSIYCDKDVGPWFPFIGSRDSGKKNMSQGEFLYKTKEKDIFFENFNEIIPNNGKDRFFDVEEVEVYKILFK